MPKHILIADDDRALVRLLAGRCRSLGLKVEEATNGFLAETSIFLRGERGHPPDLIILDVGVPEEDGLSICDELLRDDATADIPVIVLTGRFDRATLQRCRELDVHYVHKANDMWSRLEPLICNLLGLECEARLNGTSGAAKSKDGDASSSVPKVLCVDDDHLFTKVLEIRLEAYGIDVVRAFDAKEGFWQALTTRPDVIITDYSMPNGRGSSLLRRLRNHPLTAQIPAIVITGRDITASPYGNSGSSLERRLTKLGAVRVLTKPLDYAELMNELSRFIPTDGEPRNPPREHACVESRCC